MLLNTLEFSMCILEGSSGAPVTGIYACLGQQCNSGIHLSSSVCSPSVVSIAVPVVIHDLRGRTQESRYLEAQRKPHIHVTSVTVYC